jgi:tRNA A-37 threonylcarbamoyl transferase component Bud32
VNDRMDMMTELTSNGISWQVSPECRHLLFGPDGLRLEEWKQNGVARVIKHGPHRTVYHVAIPGLSFYLKHYRLADVRAWLRELVRPAKARMEYDRALQISARDVATVRPLAVGEGSRAGGPSESYLITRGLDDSQPLSTFIEKTLPAMSALRRPGIRQALAKALGEFVAKLHAAGIVHRDLHAANLLVCLDGEDQPALHLVDVHDVQLKSHLGWPARRANLVMLNRWFSLRAGRTDRLRFWLAYCEVSSRELAKAGPGSLPPPPSDRHSMADVARDLEERTWKSNLAFWRNRDRRCLLDNRHYRRFNSGTVAGHAVSELAAHDLALLLADPDAPFREPNARLLKDSRSSTVAELKLKVNGQEIAAIYKRFRVTSRTDSVSNCLRRSPAVRSWIYGHGLRERCLPTAKPLAVFHRRVGPLQLEGYLLTVKISDALDLRGYMNSFGNLQDGSRCGLRSMIEKVARLVSDLHSRLLSHRDLKAGNVLVSENSVWLIDLVGVRRYRHLSSERRVQNLARLHASFWRHPKISRADKLRFLRVYMRWGVVGKQGWKDLWRAIWQATQLKVERNERVGRPLG